MTVAAGIENTGQDIDSERMKLGEVHVPIYADRPRMAGSDDYGQRSVYASTLDPTRLDDAERVAAEHLSNLTTRLDGLRALAGSAITEPLDEVRRDVEVDVIVLGSHAREGYDRASSAEQQLKRHRQILTEIDAALDDLPEGIAPSLVVGGAWSYFPSIVKKLIEDLRFTQTANQSVLAGNEKLQQLVDIADARAFALEAYITNLGRRGVISKGSAKTAVLRAYRAGGNG